MPLTSDRWEPGAAAPEGRWLVDLGMGDGLHEPLPLAVGAFRQGPFAYGLRPSDAEPGGWRFDHEDLLQSQGGVIAGTQSADLGWINHGTAVLGESYSPWVWAAAAVIAAGVAISETFRAR